MTYQPDPSPYSKSDFGNGSDSAPSDVELEAVDVPASTVEAQTRAVPISDLKCSLYAAVSSTNRGLTTSADDRANILSLVAELERAKPPTAPADDPGMLCGRWRLLFTNALDVLSLGLLAPVAQVGQIFQNIYEVPLEGKSDYQYDIENVVQLEPAFAPVSNALGGQSITSITVSAEGRKTSDSRVDITFVQNAIKQEKIFGMQLPNEFPAAKFAIGSPVGYIETTFLDEDIRVARAPPVRNQEGGLFLLIREH